MTFKKSTTKALKMGIIKKVGDWVCLTSVCEKQINENSMVVVRVNVLHDKGFISTMTEKKELVFFIKQKSSVEQVLSDIQKNIIKNHGMYFGTDLKNVRLRHSHIEDVKIGFRTVNVVLSV